jgi:hypothetical protein
MDRPIPSVLLENKNLSLLLSGEGTVLRCTDRLRGAEIAAADTPAFLSLTEEDGSVSAPRRLSLNGDVLCAEFDGKTIR